MTPLPPPPHDQGSGPERSCRPEDVELPGGSAPSATGQAGQSRPSSAQRAAALASTAGSRPVEPAPTVPLGPRVPAPTIPGGPAPASEPPDTTGSDRPAPLRPTRRRAGVGSRRARKHVPSHGNGPSEDGRRRRRLRRVAHSSLLLFGGLLIGLGLGATAVSSSILSRDDDAKPPTRSVATRSADPTSPPPVIDESPTIPAPDPEVAPSTAPADQVTPPPDWTPTAIRVPKIKVDAPVDALGVDDKNTLEVPSDPIRVGWWSGGAQPGQRDPAVLVGHRDSSTGPAVFFELGDLVPGDEIEVDRADGSTARFMIERIESHPKTEFPTLSVYGATESSSLRLITCFGAFDPIQRSYENNLVIYANLMA